MNALKTIAKNTGVLTLMNILTIGLAMIFTIAIARFFGDVEFGKYSFAVAFTSLFAVIIDLGFNQLIIKDVARDNTLAQKYLTNIFFIKFLLSIIFFGLIVAVVNLMHYPSDTKLLVYVLGISAILTSFGGLYRAIFHGFEKMEYNLFLTIFEKIFVISIGLALLFLGYDLIHVVLVYPLGGIINVVLCQIVTHNKFTKLDFKIDFIFCKQSIKNVIPFSFGLVFVIIFDKVDMVMISMMVGDAPVGWYNAAYMVIAGLQVFPGILYSAIYPTLSKFYASSEKSLINIYAELFRYIYIFVFPIGIGTTLLSDKIILVIYGNQFINSIIALQILIWWFVCGSLAWFMGVVLQSMNKQNVVAFSMGLCAFTNIALNIILIPKMSFIGASITTVFTNIIAFIMLFYFTSKYLHKLSLLKILAKPTIAGIIMGIFIYFYIGYNLLVIILIACVIYFILLLLLKELSVKDIELIAKIVNKSGNT